MLRSPRDRKHVREINAHQLIDLIAMSAWKSAEPGLIFFDQINKYNVFAKARQSPLRATNPCGEVPLYPYESCNLGSINLVKMIHDADGKKDIDYEKFRTSVRMAVHFLDNVIDVNKYPLPQTEEITKANRRIGLGIM